MWWLLALVLFEPISQSKLGIHLIGRYTDGAKKIVASGPKVIKVLDPQANSEMVEAMRDYKRRYPNGIVVMRVWERTPQVRYQITDNPISCADDFWQKVLEPAVNRLSPSDRKLVDFLEGPNEGENTPTWESVEAAKWFGRFWERLAMLIAKAGFRPCVGSIAVGNPPGSIEEIQAKLDAFAPALRAAKQFKGAWSYHAYSLEYTTDLKVEIWYSLRYRLFYEFLRKRHPELADLPIILTEGGIDKGGNPKTDGWRARGDAEKFQAWLGWFDSELRKDEEVVGMTLFQIGDPQGWWSFDLEPVSDWLASYLASAKGK
ncbi:MAG: hypothetical protein RMK89_04145 [Armatimonadota bacterium]|nr:hypothetical protein [Armatimonadota bacterium]MDW8142637.1 hypothetical protein [Armatimonadota bacterium]